MKRTMDVILGIFVVGATLALAGVSAGLGIMTLMAVAPESTGLEWSIFRVCGAIVFFFTAAAIVTGVFRELAGYLD